jgi:uncharacterized protein YbgA (DUF1722 family)/uncharacterized protein YbbK (DUF523 family)
MTKPNKVIIGDTLPQAPKPIVVVSQCLGFAAVRYDGAILRDDFVQGLRGHVDFAQVCPEVGIGLGVPRDPIRVLTGVAGRRLVQPSTERDLTASMEMFSRRFLEELDAVDGFILKSRSPSCGIKDVKTFADAPGNMPGAKGSGFFAEAVLRRCPRAAIEDEGRLTNFRLRHHFLVKIFANARLRAVRDSGGMAGLVEFQTAYKLQWMAYSQAGLRDLGRIVANNNRLAFGDLIEAYAGRMSDLLTQPARPSGLINALMHAFGYVSKQLSRAEVKHFLAQIEEYREERLPLSALLLMLESWVLRFGVEYLSGQRFFEPYPRVLTNLVDSASKG